MFKSNWIELNWYYINTNSMQIKTANIVLALTGLSRNRWLCFEALKSMLLLSAFKRTKRSASYHFKKSDFFAYFHILLWIENKMHFSLSFVWWFIRRHSHSLLRLYDINQSKSSHNMVRVSTETESVEKKAQTKPTHI